MTTLKFVSMNCHGFNIGISSYLSGIMNMYDFVLLHETWLSEFNCHRLDLISDNFVVFHTSTMKEKLSLGILSGRPFGELPSLYKSALLIKCRFLRHCIHV